MSIAKYASAAFMFGALTACEHAKKHVASVPSPKVTRTTTVTEKIDTPVPLYTTKTEIHSATKTETSDGKPATPLHEATVKTDMPQASFRVETK